MICLLFDEIGKPGKYEALRNRVIKMINETELRDVNISSFEKALNKLNTIKAGNIDEYKRNEQIYSADTSP